MVKFILKFSLILGLFSLNTSLHAANPGFNRSRTIQALQPTIFAFQFKQNTLNSVIERHRQMGMESGMSGNGSANIQNTGKPKSKGQAFLRSIVLPGWGQYYAESKTTMKVFIVSEVLVWASYFGFTTWGNWLEDDYRTFAASHAGISQEGKSERYFIDIGNFSDIFEYNQAQLRDRDVSTLYPETDEFYWRWDSQQNQQKFEDLRVRSDRAGNRAEFALAAVFLNHFISAIHSTLAVHQFNKRLNKQSLGLKVDTDIFSNNLQLKIILSQHF